MRRGVLFDPNLLQKRKIGEKYHRYFEGDIYRYRVNFSAPSWVEFGPTMREYPKEFDWFHGKRILLRRLVSRRQRLMASLISQTVITNKNIYSLKITDQGFDIRFVLGILNSSLLSKLYISQVSQAQKDDFPQVTIRDILSLPFPQSRLYALNQRTMHDKVTELVDHMLDLHNVLAKVKTPHEKTQLQRQIETTDRQIDELVYELYGLTKEEIKIVESSVV